MNTTMKHHHHATATAARGHNKPLPDHGLGAPLGQTLRPLTPLLAAAAFAVTAMTLVGSLLVV